MSIENQKRLKRMWNEANKLESVGLSADAEKIRHRYLEIYRQLKGDKYANN